MTIPVKSSSRAYKIAVRVLPGDFDDHYDVMEPDEDFLGEILGRGPGDPDVFGYPGQEAEDVA